jgi:hypothetical protein
VTDGHLVDGETFGPQDDLGAGDGELAKATVAEAAADHDALGLLRAFDFRRRLVE